MPKGNRFGFISRSETDMTIKSKLSRLAVRAAVAVVLTSPAAFVFGVRTAEGSGYMVAFDEHGTPVCTPGGNDDCP
jgi:hypothetical protein